MLAEKQPKAIEFTVEAASVVASNEKLAARLRGKDFFDAPAHARIEFHAREIKPETTAAGGPTHVISGDLSVLGKTVPVSFPARIDVQPDAVTLSAQFFVARSAWAKAFPSRPDDLFQDRVELVSKLVFPRTAASAPQAMGVTDAKHPVGP